MKRTSPPCPGTTHHPHRPGFAVALSWLRAGRRSTHLALNSQPHGLVVSSTPPRPDGPGGSHDVAQYHCPSFTTCPVLLHPAHKVSRGGRRLGHPFLRKGSAVSQTTSSSTQPLRPCVKTRGHSSHKNMATAFPRGRGGKQMRISVTLFLLQTL